MQNEIKYSIIIDFMNNAAVRNIPGFISFQREVAKSMHCVNQKPLFNESECKDIREAIKSVKECNESWAENGDVNMVAAHELVIWAARYAMRKR